jgi:CBS-domain-containing membrane protein
MAVAHKPLLELTAGDLMCESVVMVPEEMSLQAAAHLLTQSCVTGAPVVNSEGRCVGVLSATDFVHWVVKNSTPGCRRPAPSPICVAWEIIDPETLPEDAVGNYMTRDVVCVKEDVVIGELARMMIAAHIHRVVVVDAKRRPIGIVSSTDVLAAVARAAESPSRENLRCAV